MSLTATPLALNDAMSQRERLAAAPDPAQVPVDGRSLAGLLGFAAQYGALIHFYDIDNLPAGDWTLFFQNDPSVALSLYAALDLADIEMELEHALEAVRLAIEAEQRLAHWLTLSGALTRLIGIAGGAAAPYAGLHEALSGAAAPPAPEVLHGPAASLVRHFGADSPDARLRHERPDSPWLRELLVLLEECQAALLLALQRARDSAVTVLEASLHSGEHAPQSGLWDAFAQLFRHAQHSINRFPQRLIDFYNGQVLRQERRADAPDQLILAFTPAKGITQSVLDRGTAFLAGKDSDGLPIVYALDAALTVAATSVTALRTVTLAPAPPALPASPQPRGQVVLSGEAALSAKAPAIGAPFPVFGAEQAGMDGALLSVKASLGFAVASNCLLLAGGKRAVALELSMDPGVDAGQIMAGALGQQVDGEAALARLLELAFALRYSSAAGWTAVQRYQVAPPPPGCPYVLSFELDADADAWSACPAAAGPMAAWSGLPVLCADLVQEPLAPVPDAPAIYPYAVLAQLDMAAVALRVNVSALDRLQLSGPTGPLDPAMPFPVFGSPAVRNAGLSVSAPELFAKQLNCFSMRIAWFGLPVTTTGFAGYYEGYTINADGVPVVPGTLFNNNIFSAGMEVVNPGSWTLRNGPPFQRLFQSGPTPIEPAPLRPWTDLREPVLKRQADNYYDPSLSAVRLYLAAPAYAFGDVLYAPNVMAASVQLTAAAAACAAQCGAPPSGSGPGDPLAPMLRACNEGDDALFKARIGAAAAQAVSGLDGLALSRLDEAIAQSDATPGQQSAWLESLHAALRQDKGRSRWRLLQRLARPRAAPSGYLAVHERLCQWLAEQAAVLGAHCRADLLQGAQAALAAGTTLLAAVQAAAGTVVPVARPELAATVRQLQDGLYEPAPGTTDDCIGNCMSKAGTPPFPNQPWLPLAHSVQVDYSANALAPSCGQPGATGLDFFHLCPFDQVDRQHWQAGHSAPLLAPLAGAGALEIVLAAPASSLSLLFQLAQPPSGWPTDTEQPVWQQAIGGSWLALQPLSDGTGGLRQSGIVSLELAPQPPATPLRLRVAYAHGQAARYPLLAGLLSNAARASWQGPGGAAGLGTPLPAGSVTEAATPLPAIGSIDQPEPSFGGRAAASGSAFELWMAERLRHKDYAIQLWDYATLVLGAFPSLWQVAVVTSSNGRTGMSPGKVWIVAVPGPGTPAVDDPCVPSCTGQALGEIAAFLAPRISPFIELTVTSAPYVRLTVQADVLLTGEVAVGSCLSRLNADLVAYLSPWPALALGERAANYYSYQEVARFIRQRPYVKAVLALAVSGYDGPCGAARPYYTSAPAHALTGRTASSSALLQAPAFALPAALPAALACAPGHSA